MTVVALTASSEDGDGQGDSKPSEPRSMAHCTCAS